MATTSLPPTPTSSWDVERLAPKSVATRAKIVTIALRLFAERGIDGVSLSDINVAAGQRNKNATNYHFGSKDGLLQAIFDKHQPGIIARRSLMLDALEERGNASLREIVQVLVWPVAEKMRDPDGGQAFICVDAQLIATHTLSIQNLRASSLDVPQVGRLKRFLMQGVPHLPEPIAEQRLLLSAVLLFHGLADHSRMLDRAQAPSPVIDTGLFVQNLEDCIVGLLAAPVSPATATELARVEAFKTAA